MKFLKDIQVMEGKRVLLRVDFNVPIEKGAIVDDFRIQKVLPTIEYLKKAGAKIILVAHLENEQDDSLLPVSEYLKKLFPVSFVEDFTAPEGQAALANMQNGAVALLQNIRRFPGEKKNDPAFAKQLASLGDFYVNDAFSVSHRAHASIVGVPALLPSCAGFLFQSEVENLSRAFHPPHPFLFILGGAKFDTKMPLVQKFLQAADTLFIAGALANDLFKAKGYEVGKSLVADTPLDLSSLAANPKIQLPADVTVTNTNGTEEKNPDVLAPSDRMVDAGAQTVPAIADMIKDAQFILWNGPLGEYEKGFKAPTLALAKAIAESDAESIVGGGDTLAAIQELGLFSKFTFVSSGGGAMLDFLANETLPGIQALEASH